MSTTNPTIEITDGEMVHMNYVRKHGIPVVPRVVELKRAIEKKILDAHAAGAEDTDALDMLSVLNEWIMVHTDARIMEAFTKIAMGDLASAGAFAAKGGKA